MILQNFLNFHNKWFWYLLEKFKNYSKCVRLKTGLWDSTVSDSFEFLILLDKIEWANGRMLIHTVTKSCSIASFISRTAHLFSFPVIKIFRGIYKFHIMFFFLCWHTEPAKLFYTCSQNISVKFNHATSKGSCSLLQWNVFICCIQGFYEGYQPIQKDIIIRTSYVSCKARQVLRVIFFRQDPTIL